MHIYIMRHGQAEMRNETDKLRALTEFGLSESKKMGLMLSESVPSLQWALVSPYQRAMQTWAMVAQSLPCKEVHLFDELIPNAEPQQVCDYLYSLITQNKLQNILLVSHLPLVSFLVDILAPSSGAPIFHTGTVACIEFDPDVLMGKLLWLKAPHELIN